MNKHQHVSNPVDTDRGGASGLAALALAHLHYRVIFCPEDHFAMEGSACSSAYFYPIGLATL
jgi:hypothetical protein